MPEGGVITSPGLAPLVIADGSLSRAQFSLVQSGLRTQPPESTALDSGRRTRPRPRPRPRPAGQRAQGGRRRRRGVSGRHGGRRNPLLHAQYRSRKISIPPGPVVLLCAEWRPGLIALSLCLQPEHVPLFSPSASTRHSAPPYRPDYARRARAFQVQRLASRPVSEPAGLDQLASAGPANHKSPSKSPVAKLPAREEVQTAGASCSGASASARDARHWSPAASKLASLIDLPASAFYGSSWPTFAHQPPSFCFESAYNFPVGTRACAL